MNPLRPRGELAQEGVGGAAGELLDRAEQALAGALADRVGADARLVPREGSAREQVDGGPVLGQIGDRLTDVPADEAVGILVAEGREDGLPPGTVVLVLGRGARGGEEVVGRGV